MVMFDAISNYILFLEQCLQNTSDPYEIQELIQILRTAKKVELKYANACH